MDGIQPRIADIIVRDSDEEDDIENNENRPHDEDMDVGDSSVEMQYEETDEDTKLLIQDINTVESGRRVFDISKLEVINYF